MAVVGLVGPHAIGKTTACYRWLKRYPGKLVAIIADDQWEARSEESRTRVRGWKGTAEQIKDKVEACAQSNTVYVIDSVRTTKIKFFLSDAPIIVVTCSWKVMEIVLRARCERNKKKYNGEYWTKSKLEYESHKRYLNFARKHLAPEQWTHFEIADQEKDWPSVDEHFGRVFRCLYNSLVRSNRE